MFHLYDLNYLNKSITIWPNQGKEITCLNCQAKNYLLLHDLATFYCCASCAFFIDLNNHTSEKPISNEPFKLLWPIGKSGFLRGNFYQLVGAVHRKEKGESYTWQEYCFFNPIKGFIYLSEYTGNWILLKETNIFPQNKIDNITIKDNNEEVYDLFLRYKTQCINIVGEFPYDAKDNHLKLIKEFISPPTMYLKKEYHSEIIWFKGEHITWKEIKNAFSEPEYEIEKVGKGSIQPQRFGMDYISFIVYSSLTILLMVIFTWYFESNQESKLVFSNTYFLNAELNNKKTIGTEPFYLEGNVNNVEIHLSNPDIKQTWMEIEATLINDESNEEYTLTKELYFYNGTDDGGSWTENNRNGSDVISNIPPGKYHLQITPYFGSFNINANLNVEIYRGVPVRSNLYWMIGCIALLCFIQYQWVLYFERNRWSNSNYSTYDHRSWFERNM